MVKLKKKYLTFFILITVSVVVIDQLIKYFIIKLMPIWNFNLLKIQFIKNTGAGFGILQGQTPWLTLVSLFVALGVIFFYKKIPQEKVAQILFALFLGGVIGNLIDRLFRGYVIDFINLSFWPAFNLADMSISLATIGIIVYYWKK